MLSLDQQPPTDKPSCRDSQSAPAIQQPAENKCKGQCEKCRLRKAAARSGQLDAEVSVAKPMP